MNIDHFFFRLYSVDDASDPIFLGSCFPVTPDGGVLTCRHVAEVEPGSRRLAIHDNVSGQLVPVSDVPRYSAGPIDLAFLPRALPGSGRPFLPVLAPARLLTGEDIYSYGFFVLAGQRGEIEQGYLSGKIVNFTKSRDEPPIWSLTLPYAVIEGFSGSPVLTYHNGPKVVGVAYGNRSTRILASEVLEVHDGTEHFRETINRIVEFGLAYHCAELVAFLAEVSATGCVVSDARTAIPGLPD